MAIRRLGQSILDSIPSRAAKEARAKQMNMESGYFHGTTSDIESFSPTMRGSSTDARSAKKAFWATDDPVTAGSYAEHSATYAPVMKLLEDARKAERAKNFDLAEQKIIEAEDLDAALRRDNLVIGGQNILPLRVNANLKTVDMKGRSFEDEGVSDEINNYLDSAKADGFAGVKFLNLDDAAGLNNRPATHVAMFDAKDIRSEFADFDPAKASSSNLLASAPPLAAGGILGALGLPQDATAADLMTAMQPQVSKEDARRDIQSLILDALTGLMPITQTAGEQAQMMPMSQQYGGR